MAQVIQFLHDAKPVCYCLSLSVTVAQVIKFFHDAKRGDIINQKTLACILDLVDADGDDKIDYIELTKMIMCATLAHTPPHTPPTMGLTRGYTTTTL